jgi:hypothetical protein
MIPIRSANLIPIQLILSKKGTSVLMDPAIFLRLASAFVRGNMGDASLART